MNKNTDDKTKVNYIGLYDNNVKYTDNDTKKELILEI